MNTPSTPTTTSFPRENAIRTEIKLEYVMRGIDDIKLGITNMERRILALETESIERKAATKVAVITGKFFWTVALAAAALGWAALQFIAHKLGWF